MTRKMRREGMKEKKEGKKEVGGGQGEEKEMDECCLFGWKKELPPPFS